MTPISPVFTNISAGLQSYQWKTHKTPQPNPQAVQQTPAGIDFARDFPWLGDKTIKAALSELNSLQFAQDDVNYLASFGVNVPYKNGKEAVDFLKKNKVRIRFEKPTDKNVHAQYDFSTNLIIINKDYKNCQDFPVIIAIAEAILHEASHAKDNDGDSSIQEELDSLGMNAVSHRAFLNKYGNLFKDSEAPIISDGVSIYAKLFFEQDMEKQNLTKRVRSKYGYLPAGDKVHPAGALACKIKGLSLYS